MKVRLSTCCLIAALALSCSTSVFAQASKTPALKTATAKKNDSGKSTTKGEKPVASPGWVVIEEDFWFPHRNSFAESLHDARKYHRAGEEKAAASEIDKAVSWLKFAENHADKSYSENLMVVRGDLQDYSNELKNGTAIDAKKLETAFAHATVALAQHHHWKASKALAEDDLKNAGRHLMAAAEHVRSAADSADHEFSKGTAAIFEKSSKSGNWEETIIVDKAALSKNLATIQDELFKLGNKLKYGKR